MCKVSIIIPIYNAEKYLRRALNSIISQTYTHWEAILIDDGSIDSSGKIAHEYANHDSRFIIIHQNNKGVSFARNQGLNAASGDYICFLDADDFYHSQALELCVNLAKKENADLVAFTYNRRYRVSNIIRHLLHLPESCPSSKTIIEPRYLFTQDIFKYATEYSSTSKIPPKWAIRHCQPWRCLYRHECIKNIYFIEGIIYGLTISLPFKCGIDCICTLLASISTPYFSFTLFIISFFCSSVICLHQIENTKNKA